MAKDTWNISGSTVSLEPHQRRSPGRWLHQHSLRIAVLAGLAEAIAAYAYGMKLELMLVGVIAVLGYINLRKHVPNAIRRPLWIVVMAQAVGAILVPAVYVGIFLFMGFAALMLLVLVVVMLGDLRRS